MDIAVAAGTGTTLRLWHRVKAAPERVFAAWTRPEALRLWWCPAGWRPEEIDVDLHPGGRYRLSMHRDDGTQVVAVRGQFLEIEPARRLVYTWRWDGVFLDMPETIVTVEFRAVAGGTEIALRQEVLELPMCARHLSGWLVACERLAELMQTPAGAT
jgi:uncharacterized protein YndB with AHSA1/START domain